ncbi:hypothetical protein [Acinetobacter pittii]|uniref:hypothetical protein n=1 Tax=Acinetobacter pittii TaxID=48296 RepID=UPI00083B3DE7|nr:hypothetical protein [Acinetobacter pittii]OCZ70012.1 hypothetical protein A9F99_03570 [Acinetobacter pittii]
MVKKSLEEKLQLISFWIFGGAFWYVVISYFLLSDYPIQNYSFDHKKAYDVLRDVLTLSAYFLAPGIAWALVTDWKDQHQAIERHNFFNEMDFHLHELYRISEDLFLEMTQRTIKYDDFEIQWRNKAFIIFGEVNKVNNKFRSIKIQNQNAFMKQAEELIGAFNSVSAQFQFVLSDYFSSQTSDKDSISAIRVTLNKNATSLSRNLIQIKANLSNLKSLKPNL